MTARSAYAAGAALRIIDIYVSLRVIILGPRNDAIGLLRKIQLFSRKYRPSKAAIAY